MRQPSSSVRGTLNVVGESYRQDVIGRVAASATDAAPYLEEMSGKALAITERYPERIS